MRAVDTNIVVRLLARDDPKQTAAAETFVALGAWVSHVVLVEAIWVLGSVFKRDAPSLAASVRMLLEHDTLVLQDADVVEAALAQFVARPALGFSDCLVVEIARRAGHKPVGSFDKALSKLPDTQKV
ncbi:MAG: type II toxin-antitoxin system VapC family toxin [Polyangiaceae bacterium]